MKKTSISLLIGSLLATGCSTTAFNKGPGLQLSMTDNKNVIDTKDLDKMLESAGWSEPALSMSPTPPITLIAPNLPPKNIQDKQIEISMEPGSTIKDLSAALGASGFSVVVADEAAAAKSIFIPAYKGKLGGLLNVVSKASDIYFLWQGESLYISSTERIAMSVPQDFYAGIRDFYSFLENSKKSEARATEVTRQDSFDNKQKPRLDSLAERIAYQMIQMGITEIQASQEAGFISFNASHNQLESLKAYLERAVANSAVVTMQIMVVNVTLDQDNRQGVDWESLNLAFGADPSVLINNLLGGAAGVNIPGAPDGPDAFYKKFGLIQARDGGFGATVGNRQFSMNGFINLLDKYGRAEAMQNAVMKTLTGSEVILDSASQTPYVERVEVSTQGDSGAQAQSVVTNTARDGLFMKLKPMYDATSGIVTIDAGISLDSVLQLVNLNAGGLGQLTQPITSQRRFNSVMRLKPGQTAIVGGLIYETSNTNSAQLAKLDASKNLSDTRQRNEMFIVIRPTVQALGKVAVKQENGQSVDILSQMNGTSKFKLEAEQAKLEAQKSMEQLALELNKKSAMEIKKEFEKAASSYKEKPIEVSTAGRTNIAAKVLVEEKSVQNEIQQSIEGNSVKVGSTWELSTHRMRVRANAELESKTLTFLKEGAQVVVEKSDGKRALVSLNGRTLGWVTLTYFSQV